ncbi:unnamed protein product [Rotaria socialis]
MNSLEAEYSFLAPTWKLPTVATTSLYPNGYDGSYSPPGSRINNSDAFTWNNTAHNSRYIPPSPNRGNHPPTLNQQPVKRSLPPGPSHPQTHQHSKDQYQNNENSYGNIDFSINNASQDEYHIPLQQHRHNGYLNQHNENRAVNYPPPPPPPPPPIQKRVQIIDHNGHTPSTDYMSGRESHDSSPHENRSPESNQYQSKLKTHRNQVDDNKSDTTTSNMPRSNHFKVHEYLYGLAAPDPGSYVSAYKNHRRRLQDEKVKHKAVMTQYKTFVQNGGFGPAFGSDDYRTYEEKLETEQKRKMYSKVVNQVNQYKIEEQRRAQNNGGQHRSPGYAAPKQRSVKYTDATRSHFLSSEEVRDFERKIKREHAANCKCSLHAKHNQLST